MNNIEKLIIRTETMLIMDNMSGYDDELTQELREKLARLKLIKEKTNV